MNEIILTG